MRDQDRSHLHPLFRDKVVQLDALIAAEPTLSGLQLYEGGRTPQRQELLFLEGRPSGRIVTKAKPWQSFHQFGLAADYVFLINDQWVWPDKSDTRWVLYEKLVAQVGLRSLSFEIPHCEMPLSLAPLVAGTFPSGGDATWQAWMEANIESWGPGHDSGNIWMPGAPPWPSGRPALAA